MDTTMDLQTERLGGHIRTVRRARGLTLVQLAELSDLSHPFISQLERGLARPSMGSLERIARALGTSQLELMAAATDLDRDPEASEPVLVRSQEGEIGPYTPGRARLLVRGARRFHPMEFTASNGDLGEYVVHDEDEFLHVVEGNVRVDLGPEGLYELHPGDSLYFVGGTPHRWCSPTATDYKLFIVKQHFDLSAQTPAWSPTLADPDGVGGLH